MSRRDLIYYDPRSPPFDVRHPQIVAALAFIFAPVYGVVLLMAVTLILRLIIWGHF
jgi:hypothetical protein